MVNVIVSEAASKKQMGESGADNALARTRNLFGNIFGIDLSLNERNKPVYKMSIYEVLEIDLASDPLELTLIDKALGFPVSVDITKDELNDIYNKNIKKGDIIATTLISVTNKLGATDTWKLWSIVEKLG